jgi:hypothetical protein
LIFAVLTTGTYDMNFNPEEVPQKLRFNENNCDYSFRHLCYDISFPNHDRVELVERGVMEKPSGIKTKKTKDNTKAYLVFVGFNLLLWNIKGLYYIRQVFYLSRAMYSNTTLEFCSKIYFTPLHVSSLCYR